MNAVTVQLPQPVFDRCAVAQLGSASPAGWFWPAALLAALGIGALSEILSPTPSAIDEAASIK